MKIDDLLAGIALDEDSARQFKVDVKNSDSLASEMAAFANCEGGTRRQCAGIARDSGSGF